LCDRTLSKVAQSLVLTSSLLMKLTRMVFTLLGWPPGSYLLKEEIPGKHNASKDEQQT
jgi:hypothetical protein